MSSTSQSTKRRNARLRRTVEEVMARRAAGEALPDAVLISDHADLMPELASELRLLGMLERVRDTGQGMGSVCTVAPDAFVGYEVLDEIHRGGQGVVYKAVHKPTGRRVAIKVMRDGIAGDPKDAARFEREVQILGELEHPGIVGIHTSGVKDGRFYYVMDFVEGVLLDSYAAGCALRKRLELFVQVCDAVNAAHLRGVIHRDLKPGNILVDGRGRALVLDFGLARLDAQNGPEMTVAGQFVGSMPWASPEQAAGESSKIDIRTDVYSLGVVLFHILTGRFPYAVEGGPRDVLDNILRAEPTRPRGIDPTIPADVEAIVLKCLAKDRSRRYQSAGELGEDLRRYLSGWPVAARPPSTMYQISTFARRNKGLVAATGAVAATLLLGALGFAWQAHRVGIERDATAVERDRATSIKDYLLSTLRSSDPRQEGHQDMLVSEAILRGIDRLGEGALSDQPWTKAEILSVSADILRSNGKAAAALPLAQQSLALLRSQQHGESPAVASGLLGLAGVLEELGRAAEAEPLYEQALRMNQRLYKGDHPDVAASLSSLAGIRNDLGRPAEAEPLYVEALEMHQRLSTDDRSEVAQTLGDLGRVRQTLGRAEDAERLFVQSLEMERRLFKGDHPDVATSLTNLAFVRQVLGREAEAEPLYLESLEMNRRLFRGDHPQLAVCMNNLAGVLESLQRPEDAERFYVQALEMRQRLFKGDHPNVATSLNNLAYVRQVLGRPAEAERLYQKALEMHQRIYNGDHPSVAMSMTNLARVRHLLGRTTEAQPLFDDATAMLRRLFPNGSPALARVLWRSASASLDRGDAKGALQQAQEAVTTAERFLPPEHPQLKEYRDTLAKCRDAMAQ